MSHYYCSWSEEFFYMSRNKHFITNKVESILFRISREKLLPFSKYLDNHLTCKALKVPQIILLSWTKIMREFCNMPGYWTEYTLPDYRHISWKLQKKKIRWQAGTVVRSSRTAIWVTDLKQYRDCPMTAELKEIIKS